MKNIVGFFYSSLNNFTIQRILVAILIFASLFLAAKTTETNIFAQLTIIIFLAKFLQILNFGAVNGFLVTFYNKKQVLSDLEFITLFSLQLGSFVLVGSIIALIWAPYYLWGIICFAVLIPIYAIEPLFRVKRKFYVSLLPDIILSVALVLISLLAMSGKLLLLTAYISINALFTILIIAPVLIYLVVISPKKRTKNAHLKLNFKNYFHLLRYGLPAFFSTALFALATGLDRMLLPIHSTDSEISVYMMSIQLAMGSMLILSSLNFVGTIDFGEALKKPNNDVLKQASDRLLRSLLIALISLIIIFFVVFVLENYFLLKFVGLIQITMIFAIGLSIFFIAGSITPVTVYLRKQIPLTVLMAVIFLVILGNNIVTITLGRGIIQLVSVTSFFIALYGVVAIIYTLSLLKNSTD